MKQDLINQSILLMQLIMKDWDNKAELRNKYFNIEVQLEKMLKLVEEELNNINTIY